MTDRNIWFITDAGRGMGVDFATAALAEGDAVAATGRNPDAVAKAVGEADDLLAVKLDVTSTDDPEQAVRAVDCYERIDVLVNNARAALRPHRLDLVGAGLVGCEFCPAYAASKFGLEGWMESLEPEVAPFGIHTTIVDQPPSAPRS